jgi:hypothetical protein
MTQRLDQNPAQGVALMLAAILTFSVMDATAKALVQNYAPGQVVWVRFSASSCWRCSC